MFPNSGSKFRRFASLHRLLSGSSSPTSPVLSIALTSQRSSYHARFVPCSAIPCLCAITQRCLLAHGRQPELFTRLQPGLYMETAGYLKFPRTLNIRSPWFLDSGQVVCSRPLRSDNVAPLYCQTGKPRRSTMHFGVQ